MARIVVLETDPVSKALIEDGLHVSGHRVILADDPVGLVSTATEGHADLVVLALEMTEFSGLGVIRQLRDAGETRSLPIVALSKNAGSADRIAALRSGADDYLTKPFDIEELVLRVDRLLGRRGEASQVLKGDLESHPTWELVQYVQQVGKSGDLSILGARGSGQLRVRNGRVVSARWQNLRDREAFLAMLETREGQFRLTTEPAPEEESAPGEESGAGFAIQEVLMEAAWLDDELAKRREHLPATGVSLRRRTDDLPAIDDELRRLPIEKLFERLGRKPRARLFDLIQEADEAPSKVRLAIAWMVEQGAISSEEAAGSGEIMNTVEISSSMVLDLSVHNLLAAARDAGLGTSPLTYLLLAEAGVQSQLVELLESEPGFRSHQILGHLAEQLRRRQGGSAEFVTDYGTLSLHARILEGPDASRIETILPECAGVFLWVEEAEDQGVVQNIIQRMEAGGEAMGVLVTKDAAAAKLAEGSRCWRVAHHAPRSLIGVLRLLHPASAS